MKRIAVVGVGLLGSAVASRLLAGGFTVTGYDTRPDQMAGLASRVVPGGVFVDVKATHEPAAVEALGLVGWRL